MVVALVSPPPRVRAAVCVQRCVCVSCVSVSCLCSVFGFTRQELERAAWLGRVVVGLVLFKEFKIYKGSRLFASPEDHKQNSTTKDHSMHSSSKEDGTRARRSSRLNSLAPAKQANEDVHDLYIHNHPSRRRRSVRGPRCHAPICRENNKLFLLSKRWSTPLAWWRGAGPSLRPSARCARR